jgi:hypothetical protein
MKKIYFLVLLSCFVFLLRAQNNTWINAKQQLEDLGCTIQFKYPNNLKFEWIENCLCIGVKTTHNEYSNTMDWGIWLYEATNYHFLSSNSIKTMFGSNYIIKKDTILLLGQKVLHTQIRGKNGNKYLETLILKYKNWILEINNDKGYSKDFELFYKSISIKDR